jgi:UDP-3-O-[3-hydroxymyristoyl] N-acetylglucosamine deacetylase
MHLQTPIFQRTLNAAIHCTGIGLHKGEAAALVLRPAPVDTGILFRRLGGPNGPVEIPAHWENSAETALCTVLRHGGTEILTIEHLMAALAGCGIDNCVVEVKGAEVPIMDGSADKFVFLIECAGIVEQPAARRSIRVLKRVRVESGGAWAEALPGEEFAIEFEIEFPGAVIGRQTAGLVIDPASFKRELARARTFGFRKDAERLHAAGRALGASLENTVVLDGDTVMNEEGLRFPDEFVRHKMLDAVGDLALAGAALIGRFRFSRSSHALTRRLLAALFADPSAWAETGDSAGEWAEPERARA